MLGELVRSVSNTRILIDLHLPRLTHLHDKPRFDCEDDFNLIVYVKIHVMNDMYNLLSHKYSPPRPSVLQTNFLV